MSDMPLSFQISQLVPTGSADDAVIKLTAGELRRWSELARVREQLIDDLVGIAEYYAAKNQTDSGGIEHRIYVALVGRRNKALNARDDERAEAI